MYSRDRRLARKFDRKTSEVPLDMEEFLESGSVMVELWRSIIQPVYHSVYHSVHQIKMAQHATRNMQQATLGFEMCFDKDPGALCAGAKTHLFWIRSTLHAGAKTHVFWIRSTLDAGAKTRLRSSII